LYLFFYSYSLPNSRKNIKENRNGRKNEKFNGCGVEKPNKYPPKNIFKKNEKRACVLFE